MNAIRSTPQRRAVLDVVQQAPDHPTAADVHRRVCEIMPGVGAATIYRTLAMLVESGQILELRLGHSSAIRYDRNISHHDHLVCDSCGKVEDIRVKLDHTEVLGPLEDAYEFRLTSYDVRVRGVCADCDSSEQLTDLSNN